MNWYVIYFNPIEYPGRYVVRRWYVSNEGRFPDVVAHVTATIDEARRCVPRGYVNVGRQVKDDPVITEVWI